MAGAQAQRYARDGVTLAELVLADLPERWRALGFDVAGEELELGGVSLRLAGEAAGRGIVGWSLRGLRSTELDGLPTTRAPNGDADADEGSRPDGDGARAGGGAAPAEHRNGIVAIDHVVAMTPALDRTVQALGDAGLDLRRIREQPTPAGAPRQAFFRLGGVILEVVQEPEHVIAARGEAQPRPARLWGVALLAPDLELTVAALGTHAGAVRDAVQPGRRIATVKRSAGLAVPVALMSPQP